MNERIQPNYYGTSSRIVFVCFLEEFEDTKNKEVCNRGVACSLLKLGSLEKTVIASLFHSGLHSGTIFCEKTMSYVIIGNDRICPFFDKKRPKNIMMPN